MDWLTNWDDLVHGTAVFGAAVPFLLALLLAWRLPERFWWLGVVGALLGSYFWLFRIPAIPPESSEDVMLWGLALLVAGLALARVLKWPGRVVAWCALFAGLAWLVYPAWLADEGTLSRKLLVCGGVGACTGILAIGAEWLHGAKSGKASLAVFVPPTIALAVLLQLGGSARFGQAAGAMAAAIGAFCIVLIVRKSEARPVFVAALWGMLFALLGWSGWLFAEIRYGLAALLLLAPVAGMLVNFIPLPRRSVFLGQLWDGLASGAVSVAVAAIAIGEYVAEMGESEGY